MERPALTFDIKLNDELKTVKMTYGIFNEILQIIPDPQNIGDLFISDAALRDYVARRVLSGSKRITKEEELIDPYEMDVDMDDLNDLILWVGDHVMYFFMNNAGKTGKLMEKYQNQIQQMQETQSSQSKSGSEA